MPSPKKKMSLDDLREHDQMAYDAFVNHLINNCDDEFQVLSDGRIINADRPDGTVIVWDPKEEESIGWEDTYEDLSDEEGDEDDATEH